jgi:hypothetical protein
MSAESDVRTGACGCRECHPTDSRSQFVFVDETTEPVRSSQLRCIGGRGRHWCRGSRERRRLVEGASALCVHYAYQVVISVHLPPAGLRPDPDPLRHWAGRGPTPFWPSPPHGVVPGFTAEPPANQPASDPPGLHRLPERVELPKNFRYRRPSRQLHRLSRPRLCHGGPAGPNPSRSSGTSHGAHPSSRSRRCAGCTGCRRAQLVWVPRTSSVVLMQPVGARE